MRVRSTSRASPRLGQDLRVSNNYANNLQAHCIKNPSAATTKAAYALHGDRRWAVTGTPIQNRLPELCSLFRFLRVNPYHDRESFDEDVTNLWTSGREEEAVSRLKNILKFIMLRRSNKTLDLPDREDTQVLLRFGPDEQREYDCAKETAIRALDDMADSASSRKAYINALSKINELRMMCNHGLVARLNSQRSFSELAVSTSGAWSPASSEKTLDDLPIFNMALPCANCQSFIDPSQEILSSPSDFLNPDCRPFVILTKCFLVWCAACVDPFITEYCSCLPRCPYKKVVFNSQPPTPMPLQATTPITPITQHSTKVQAVVNDLSAQGQTVKR